jgi:murein peptide amidase A
VKTTTIKSNSVPPATPSLGKGALERLLAPLDQFAASSPNLVSNHEARFSIGDRTYVLPRYHFIGPKGGDTPIRLGVFAAIHGDEPEGAHAIVHFARLLESNPDLAAGYCLSFYPVCNPTGFEDGTRHSRSGFDLNREFWKRSREPEVRLLQTELLAHSFNGIISLHSDDAGDGFYGLVRGATLARHLLNPALQAAEAFLPRDSRTVIAGIPAANGIIQDDHEGVLSAPPNTRPRPFEITLQTPRQLPAYLKECAFVAALQTILVEYRKLISYAQNI